MEAHALKEYVDQQFPEIFGDIADLYLPRSHFRDADGIATTVKPTVVIGLGGSGTKAITRLKWRAQEFYAGAEFENERRSLAFLAMDTLSYDNITKEDPDAARYIRRVISRDDYVYLGGFNPGQYLERQKSLSRDLEQWWDERYAPPQVVIEDGAKRVRQLGRLALFRNREEVRRSIREAINNVVTIHASLVQQGRVKGIGGDAGNLDFYIFSGTCGGTGSGTLLDVTYLAYSLAQELGRTPIIHLVLFMPRLFIEAARRKRNGEWLGKAYEANAYAFFKELQFLVEAGPKVDAWRMDARERPEMDHPPYSGWKPNRIYLIGTEVAGREIGLGQFDQIYTLAADYILQAMVTPVGASLERLRQTNDAALGTRSGDRPNAFSSVGIAYIVYPSKTLARTLSCHLLKDTLDSLGRSPLSEEERRAVPAKAGDLFTSLGDQLNPSRIDAKLLAGVENFIRAIAPEASILQRMEREDIKAHELLQQAQEAADHQEIIAKGRVDENFDVFAGDALRALRAGIDDAVKGLVAQGIEVVKGVLSHLKSKLAEAKSVNLPAAPLKAERDAKESIQRVAALEGKVFAWRGKQRIADEVRLAARNIREGADLTIRGYAVERRSAYLAQATKTIDEMLDRVKRAQGLLTSLRDDMEERRTDPALEYDETSVSVTTQFVPIAPALDTLEELYTKEGVNLGEFADQLLAAPALREAFLALGSIEESEAKRGLEAFLRGAVGGCVARIGRRLLEQQVTDVIRERWENDPAGFKDTYGQNLLDLADPSWALNADRIPPPQRVTADLAFACPENLDDRFLPQGLLQGEAFPGDPRMMLLLKSEHAAPLFAVRGVTIHRAAYRQWLKEFQASGEAPPHISRDWNKEDALEDLEPTPPPPPGDAFAQGLFADWLVREKKEARLLAVLAGNDPTGPVSVRGARGNYFWVTYEKRQDGKLYKKGEVRLETTKRYEAARAIDAKAEEAVEFFMSQVDDLFPPSDLRALTDEYLDFLKNKYPDLSVLTVLDGREQEEKIRELPDERQRSLIRQLLQEIETLTAFKVGLEGA